ncbi:MAG: hypothetical protein PHS14_02950 [Elusimicrobia bacterium]|nr:hypothetical protein [Elusimicrobiota bacterium]
MSKRPAPDLLLPLWACVGLAFALLLVLLWVAAHEPVLPDADDCRARGQAEDCWKAYEFVAPDDRAEPAP